MGQFCSGKALGTDDGEFVDDTVQAKMRQAHWVPLESNPEVMNGFARKVGLPRAWEFVDVFGVDEDLLAMVPRGCVAVTLLFRCSEELMRVKEEQRARIERDGQRLSPSLVYLKQYIGNACGTIACIHCMANNEKELGLDEASPLRRFLALSSGAGPDRAGRLLADATDLHVASEAVATTVGQTAAPEVGTSVDHHFVAFIQKDGDVFELDGCKAFPVNHGPSGGDLMKAVAKVVKAQFMDKDPTNIHFNMMALVPVEQ